MKPHFSRCTQLSSLTLAFVLSATSMLSTVGVAQAQGASALEEIIVTARKRDESLQEVPVVVNVLTQDAINSQRIESIRDIGTIVPGMVASKTISGTSGMIYLRGVGTGSGNPGFDQAVAINVDGMGINSAQMMNAGMFDLKQIEVLKGPQALFYGKNSPGGVIAIHTNDPGDEFEGQITAAYETVAEEKTVQGIISGPLSETVGARLAFGRSEADDTWYTVVNENRFEVGPFGPVQTAYETGNPEQDTTFLLGTLLWQPSENFSAKLKLAHMEDNLTGSSYGEIQKIWCPFGDFQNVLYPIAGVPCEADDRAITPGASAELNASLFDGEFAGEGDSLFNNENNMAILEMNYALSDDLDFTSVTGYFDNEELRLADSSFENAVGLPAAFVTELEQFSQELRLVSSYDSSINFSLGAFYESKEIGRDSEVSAAAPALVPLVGVLFPISIGRQIREQEGTSWSVFGQLNWDLSEQLTLAIGGRYSYEEKEVVSAIQIKDPNVYGIPGGLPLTSVPLSNPKTDWDNFSPEVTLSYQYNDDIMFFASYREGFKSGGYDLSYGIAPRLFAITGVVAPLDLSFDEETVDGFEVGMKSTLLDGSLRLNLTAYSYAYEDLQLSKFDGDTLSFSIFNAGKASVDGIEVETLWSTPVDGLTLSANIAYGSSEFDEFLSPCWSGQTIALGCQSIFDPDEGGFALRNDMAGENLPFASDLSATLGVTYDMSISDKWNLGLNFNASFKDDYNPVSQLSPEQGLQDAYWWVNAGARLYSSDDKWEVYVRGVNLTDELYRLSGGPAPGQGNAALNGTNDASGLPDWISYIQGGQQLNVGVTYKW